jgi:hypothetical protein
MVVALGGWVWQAVLAQSRNQQRWMSGRKGGGCGVYIQKRRALEVLIQLLVPTKADWARLSEWIIAVRLEHQDGAIAANSCNKQAR